MNGAVVGVALGGRHGTEADGCLLGALFAVVVVCAVFAASLVIGAGTVLGVDAVFDTGTCTNTYLDTLLICPAVGLGVLIACVCVCGACVGCLCAAMGLLSLATGGSLTQQ